MIDRSMFIQTVVFACLIFSGVASSQAEVTMLDVELVWSGHPVGFKLLTHPPYQFVAYYDADRRMSVAQRRLGETSWKITKLPQKVGWDSHNYVTMAIDRKGYLHLSGNMHCVPMVYFRSEKPMDASTLKREPNMVGPGREKRVTYPMFIKGPKGELVFRYRDGGSGNGDDLYNRYDEKTRQWKRLVDTPLTNGEGKMNAYCTRPALGPDGYYHIVWVWRDTPDCATNHDLSYARSRDLVHWESGDGRKLQLPITIGQKSVVDPVPAGGGMINGGYRLNFDSKRRPIIVYHKFDTDGWTQLYIARLENKRWNIRKITDWQGYRWEFKGGGSIVFDVRIGSIHTTGNGQLKAGWYRSGNRGVTILDEATLKPIKRDASAKSASTAKKAFAASNQTVKMAKPIFPGMIAKTTGDAGASGDSNVRYHLSWWTLAHNRDRPIKGKIPPPVMLKIVKTVQ